MKRIANGEPMIFGVTDFSVILFHFVTLFCSAFDDGIYLILNNNGEWVLKSVTEARF